MRTVSLKEQTKAAKEANIASGKITTERVFEVLRKYPKGITTIVIKQESGLNHGAIESVCKRNKKLLDITYVIDDKRKRLIKIIKIKKSKKDEKL